jgi:hypothetical protein
VTKGPTRKRDFRKERALTSFTGDHRETRVSLTVDPSDLRTVEDLETREYYATGAERMVAEHDPDDVL